MITITMVARTVGMAGTLTMRCAAEPPSRDPAVWEERGGKECGWQRGDMSQSEM